MHVKNVRNLISVVEHYGGKLFEDKILMEDTEREAKENGEKIDTDECKKRTKAKGAALEVIKSSKWRAPLEDIRTQLIYKNDVYPSDLAKPLSFWSIT